jgi:hypothetical protein
MVDMNTKLRMVLNIGIVTTKFIDLRLLKVKISEGMP